MSYKVSKNFWSNINNYPDYPHLLRRRFIDLCFILKHQGNSESLLDIGCGDCNMLILLQELTSNKELYGFDISNKLMRRVPGLVLKVADLTQKYELPQTDVTISLGMFPYIFKDEHLYNILRNIKSDLFIVRAPCTSNQEDEYINKFSTELDSNYSAIYRKPSSYIEMFLKFFDTVKSIRSYSDEIESKYNTKHYYFICKKGVENNI